MSTRIIVTETNAALRDGIVALIEAQPDMRVVGTPSDAGGALGEVCQIQPEVMIVDVDVPDAIDLMRRLRRERPQTRIIALVNYEWDLVAQVAAQAAGSSCLPKDHISSRLLALIRELG